MSEPVSSTIDDARATGPLAMLYRIADGVALAAGFLAAVCIAALTGLILCQTASNIDPRSASKIDPHLMLFWSGATGVAGQGCAAG